MIRYTTSTAESELLGILQLQKENLSGALTKEEMNEQGFVTVIHRYDDLKKLNDIEKHVIAKDQDEVIAYLLAMTQLSKSDIPILIPMFDMFSQVSFAGKTVSQFNYIVVGQVCVGRNYRGKGVLDNCYTLYKDHYKSRYDFAITEIDSNNPRSLQAHKRIGFGEISRYGIPGENEWVIVLWDWNNINNSDSTLI